ncbi:5'-methylthioadenosine nucleosidase [Lysinibacillus sphaericus]|uniref:5'-methylthioadenosine nucleosidase n=1 Tax=Lysinibacillus sphaericus TaxID=1421 RepID=A0A544UIT6_LYSSH|nr:5'-methylthioadenosine nucleosidase [Lysinibacillus sp. SDF0037]
MNLFISRWEAFIMLFLTAGAVIITMLLGTLISVELSESAE